MKKMTLFILILFTVSVFAGNPEVYAKKYGGNPAGWSKGEKKGWGGAELPPGLAKKDANKAQKAAEKQAKQVEKKAAKKAKQAEKNAAKKARQAEKEAAKKAKEAEKAARAVKAAKRI